jgi:predicted amidophosphoribosyltransferase
MSEEKPVCCVCGKPADLIDREYDEFYCTHCWEQFPASERGNRIIWLSELEGEKE